MELSQLDFGQLYRLHSAKVRATLIRLLKDFGSAEDATQEAFAAAMESWPRKGVPKNPVSWLISAGRFRAIDKIRRESRFRELQPDLVALNDEIETTNEWFSEQDIGDDQLRLIFTCCHPAIDPKIQVPLTLREVCGLTTLEVASAYLVDDKAMAQRIVRGKSKIKDAGIPYRIPELSELPERIESVLKVIYLIFNEGYSATLGHNLVRDNLCSEAIRLARLLDRLLPTPELSGLLALMLFHQARSHTRYNEKGDIVLLESQDRSLWNHAMIEEGQSLVETALSSGQAGSYCLQAAIAALHSEAAQPELTDWPQIVALYDLLLETEPTPVVALNRAVAVAMLRGEIFGLDLIDGLLAEGHLRTHHLAHSARGELLRRLQRFDEAESAFEQAFQLATSEPSKRFLQRKLESCRSGASLTV